MRVKKNTIRGVKSMSVKRNDCRKLMLCDINVHKNKFNTKLSIKEFIHHTL